ncbi:MAG: hypothetical protein QGG00_04605 [Verrucomicrobiota bacterium]|jgi:hypothetical protein|nr:hypothetical protein [Verrucomicrobiota bacterium]
MKYLLLTTITTVLLLGCGEVEPLAPSVESEPAEAVAESPPPESKPDYSGTYLATIQSPGGGATIEIKLKPDNTFVGIKSDEKDNQLTGKLTVEGNLLVFSGVFAGGDEGAIKINKTTLKLIELSSQRRIAPLGQFAPGGAYFKKQ